MICHIYQNVSNPLYTSALADVKVTNSLFQAYDDTQGSNLRSLFRVHIQKVEEKMMDDGECDYDIEDEAADGQCTLLVFSVQIVIM